jgi:hypothetical protein
MSEPRRDDSALPQPPALGADLIIPLLAAGLTIYFLVDTAGLAWEARATGTVIGAALLLLVALQVGRIGLLVARGQGSLSLGELVKASPIQAQRLALLTIMILFVGTITWIGTTLGLLLAMAASMWVLGVRDMRALLGLSLAVAGVVYVLFIVLLQSRLPTGPIEALTRSLIGS